MVVGVNRADGNDVLGRAGRQHRSIVGEAFGRAHATGAEVAWVAGCKQDRDTPNGLPGTATTHDLVEDVGVHVVGGDETADRRARGAATDAA